ncbi:MAG: hypothetical protein WC627_10375 [Legionella sp.]
MIKFVFNEPKSTGLSDQTSLNIIDNYLYIQRILDSKKTDLVAHEQILIKDIQSKFPDFRTTYDAYLQSPLLDSDAIRNTTKLLLVAAFAENKALADVTVYVEEAKKLLLLFKTYSNVIQYFKRYAQINTEQPVRDLCNLELLQEFIDGSSSRNVLDSLSKTINVNDNRKLQSESVQFEDQRLLKSIIEAEHDHDLNYYQKMFHYGLNDSDQYIQGFLSRNWEAILSKSNIHTYPILVRTLFSLIKDNKGQFDELVNKVISCSYANRSKALLIRYHRTPVSIWLKSPDKNIIQDNIGAILWTMLIEVMDYISDCDARNIHMVFMETILDLFDEMVQALRHDDTRFLSLLTLENPFDLALLSSYLKQTTTKVESVIQCIKLLLINFTPKIGMQLIGAYQQKLPEFFNKKIIEELTSYVASLERARLLRALHYNLQGTWSLKRDSNYASELAKRLSGFDFLSRTDKPFSYSDLGDKWILVTEKKINEAWTTVLEYFNLLKQRDGTAMTNNPLFDEIYTAYARLDFKLMDLELKNEEQEEIIQSWNRFSQIVNSKLNKLSPPEKTEFRTFCSKYHEKMIALEVEEKERTVKYQNLLQSNGVFAHKDTDKNEVNSNTEKGLQSLYNVFYDSVAGCQ